LKVQLNWSSKDIMNQVKFYRENIARVSMVNLQLGEYEDGEDEGL